MSGGARRGSPASSALSLLLLIAPLLAFAPAALASVPRDATALSSPSLAADVGALAAPPLEHTESAAFRVFVGDELGDAHVLVFELSYPKTRVGGLGLPDEARVEDERSLRLEAPWACDERSGGKASGSGEFRIFDPAGTSRSTSAFGWNRLFQGREYIGVVDAYDFRARILWPELGRFGQEDPAGTGDSPNRYQALRAAWISATDPYGLAIQLTGDDPTGDLELLKRSLSNPAAANQLRWYMDGTGRNWVTYAGSSKQFRSAAIPDEPRYRGRIAKQGLPLPTDPRTVEDKIADIIDSEKTLEFRTGSRFQMWGDWPFRGPLD